MKNKLLIFFLLFSLYVFPQRNIYEDALYHMISENVESLEASMRANHHDSIFSHEVVLVKNDIVDKYIHQDSIANYKIKKIDNVKYYIDTVMRLSHFIIYEIQPMDFISIGEAPFHICFYEYGFVKKKSKLVNAYNNLGVGCYQYIENKKKKSKELKYLYWDSIGYSGNIFMHLREKGWID